MSINVKKLFSLIVVFTLIISTIFCTLFASTNQSVLAASENVEVWDGSIATAFGGGNGNWDNPYIINNASQLAYIGVALSSGTGTAYIGKNFKLSSDIYLNEISDYEDWETQAPANVWDSMGKYSSWNNYRDFGGIIDGDGHTIYGLYISGSVSSGTGLFGAVNNATIKNLNIEKAYVTGTTVVGGISGIVRGNTTIENCGFSGIVEASSNFAGGIAGKYEGSEGTEFNINSCYTNGDFTAGGVIVGGFIGEFVSNSSAEIGININNSYCTANLTGNDYRVGGFVGRATNGGNETKKRLNIRKSFYYGTLSSKSTGTLVGMDVSSITNVIDTFYNSDIIGGADKTLTYGTSKTTNEFKDGTVTELLNSVEDKASDVWDWRQGDLYPVPDRKLSLLKNLVTSKGKFEFAPAVTDYEFKVSNSVETITVTPTASDINAKITVNDVEVVSATTSEEIQLTVGLNEIIVKVIGSDNSETIYKLNITRRIYTPSSNVWDGEIADSYAGGDGKEDSPYLISNANELAYLGSILNTGNGTAYIGKYFKLTSDIYLNEISDYEDWENEAPANVWDSMGKYSSWNNYRDFGGIIDGDGHTIYGLYISGSVSSGTGLFGAVNNATIKNLNIEKAYVTGTTVVGGISGIVRGNTTIENCGFSGIVEASSNFAGGIAGKYEGSEGTEFNINSCYTSGDINVNGVIAGGFIGDYVANTSNKITININNSYSSTNIMGNDYRVGGFVGRASNGGNETKKSLTIRKSHYYGTLSSAATGTLVGMDLSSITTATDTYYNGEIIGGADKTLTYGTSKTTNEFKDGTVTELLNSVEDKASDVWDWRQGDLYPVPDRKLSLLKNLVTSKGKFEFTPAVTEYEFKVANSVESITVTPTASDINAKITVNGCEVKSDTASQVINLAVGLNAVKVEVLASDNSRTVYTLNITRKALIPGSNIWDGAIADSFAGGTGTAENPYLIANAAQLAYLSDAVKSSTTTGVFSGKYFKLISDIILNDTSDLNNWHLNPPDNVWEPIGYYKSYGDQRSFCGTLDGDGYTIYGLYVNNSNDYGAGLFGHIYSATIKNLSIKSSYVEGQSNIGGIVGYASWNNTLENNSFSGKIIGGIGKNSVGGIVGKYEGSANTTININSCYSHGEISGNIIVGGILGYSYGSNTKININNSYSSMNISAVQMVGGFVGRLDDNNNNRILNIRKGHFAGKINVSDQWKSNSGTFVGQIGNGILNIKDAYYINNLDVQTKQGIEKSNDDFSNGVVTELLNKSAKDISDVWDWAQGDKYPIEKRARLKSLTLSRSGINFSPTNLEYNISVSNRVDYLTVTPTAYYSDLKLTINGMPIQSGMVSSAITLTVGKTVKVSIKVSSEDGSSTTYILNITREEPVSGPSTWDGGEAYGFADGTGTEDDPYIIETADELAFLASSVNSSNSGDWGSVYKGKYFKLVSDIILNTDYNDYSNWDTKAPNNIWTPIGKITGKSTRSTFGGIFDGGNHTIYGMYVSNDETTGSGLFGSVSGQVKNLFVKKSYVSGDSSVGGIVGYATDKVNYVLLSNVGFEGIVKANNDFAGGLVGRTHFYHYSFVRVNSSYSEGSVNGKTNVGGIFGGIEIDKENGGSKSQTIQINNSYSGMKVSAKTDYVGGLAGYFAGDNKDCGFAVRKSHFVGSVSGGKVNRGPILGGVSDKLSTITIKDRVFYAKDSISGTQSDQMGAASKSRTDFGNETVMKLLNDGAKDLNADVWDWIQGDDYPVSPYAYMSLTDIILSSGDLTYNPSIFEYSALVDMDVKTVNVTAIAADESFTITINGQKVRSGFASESLPVKEGEATIFTIVVTRPNGRTQTFSVQVVKGGYMVHFIGEMGVANGEFGQEIYLDPNKTYTFSFNYYSKGGITGLRTLAKYENTDGVLTNMPPVQTMLDKKKVEWVYKVTIPKDAKVVNGKVKCKFGIKKNESSHGYFANFKLIADDDSKNTNLFVNPDFKQNLYGWMDLKYATYTDNTVFKGPRGEVELVPYIASYFVERPDDSNDKIFNDGDWFSKFKKAVLKNEMTDRNENNNQISNEFRTSIPWILIIIIASVVALAAISTFIIILIKKNKK